MAPPLQGFNSAALPAPGASEFGVSPERVRQIDVRSFEKVQEAVKEPRRGDGYLGASAGALASNPLPWWEKPTMRRYGYVYGNRNDARGSPATAPNPRAADGKLSEVS